MPPTTQVALRLEPEVIAMLDARAAQLGVSRTEVVRIAARTLASSALPARSPARAALGQSLDRMARELAAEALKLARALVG